MCREQKLGQETQWVEKIESVGEETVERTSEVATRVEILRLKPMAGALAWMLGQRG